MLLDNPQPLLCIQWHVAILIVSFPIVSALVTFSVCLEQNTQRTTYGEKVPFRLTDSAWFEYQRPQSMVKEIPHFMVDRKQTAKGFVSRDNLSIKHVYSHLLLWRPCPSKVSITSPNSGQCWRPGGQHVGLCRHSSCSNHVLNHYSEQKASLLCLYILPCPQLRDSADVFTSYSWNYSICGALWLAALMMWTPLCFPWCCLTSWRLISFCLGLIFWCLFTHTRASLLFLGLSSYE